AYDLIDRGEMVACCDLIEERATAFAEEFGIPSWYTDLDEMLAAEEPDVVHAVTTPTIRYSLMKPLADAGVPGVIVEKPICIGADDYKQIRELEAASDTKFVVNHQLRYHPRILDLLDHVSSGAIGEVRCLDASAMLPMNGQGVHVLDLMFAFADYVEVDAVQGACAGFDDINGTHPSPSSAAALITFADGKRGLLQSGEGVPEMAEDVPRHMHKRIAAYGTTGFIHWSMHHWEKTVGGEAQRGEHVYAQEDNQGQANLTNALFDWLGDDDAMAPTNLAVSLDEWLVILACYHSTVAKTPVQMPFDPPDDLLQQYIDFVGAQWTNPHGG
ncbi:MAG: Gfo/Idh/MocA family oxidoreductase, partial [Armatimonadota bacterium]|nr:Gfo/Idh/MocA family oxidoreductase [Armatimonadota bacterium]